MKKSVITLFTLIATINLYAQINVISSDSIRLNSEGKMAVNLKKTIQNSILFNRTLSWISSTYKNPDKVVQGKVENKSVSISGHKSYAIHWKSLGVTGGMGMSYHIYFDFNDTIIIYRFDIDKLSNESTGGEDMSCSQFFKKDGSVKPLYSMYKNQLEAEINTLFFSYIDKLNNSSLTSDEAIAELKKAKEKLELELISQEDYDKIKAELLPFIK